MARTIQIIASSLILLVGLAAHWVLLSRSTAREAARDSVRSALPKPNTENQYVSSDRCRSCPPQEYESWHRTYHRTMTQAAFPENVLGRFDGTEIESDGLIYQVFQKGGQLTVEMPDPDEMMYVVQGNKPIQIETIPRVQLPIVMTTGSHHYQTY